ncbi:MAG TPA: hypothetical protein ENG35_01015 [Desulfobacteraceae bacterium]|nr:hypothetical protein [Desulfobacteraceae bacterium]
MKENKRKFEKKFDPISEAGLKTIFYIEYVNYPSRKLHSLKELIPENYDLKEAVELCKKMGLEVLCDYMVVRNSNFLRAIGAIRREKNEAFYN